MAHKKNEIFKLLILRTLGNFFILFTIFGFFATFGPAIYYEALFHVAQYRGVHFQVADVAQGQELSPLGKIIAKHSEGSSDIGPNPGNQSYLSAVLSGQSNTILVPQSTEFGIIIPKIGANEAVVANVDPSNPDEYIPILQHAVAHAKGSGFPGLNGNIYLFAHSTDNFWDVGRYNAVFYLLHDLDSGDDVTIFFQNRRYDYTVFDKKIVGPEDVSHLNANLGQGETVTLQTCWPPGTSWQRLLVFARPKAVQ